MSIRDHDEEVIRWLDSPEGTKVWEHDVTSGKWELTDDPKWLNDRMYIVNDKHAKIRMTWVNKGKPPVQYCQFGVWVDIDGDPRWNLSQQYRIKPSVWETPEGENPIQYHAKRIDPDWKFNMNDFNQKRWHIGFYALDKTYTAELSQLQICIGTHYMSQKAAEQIAEALNLGELKLKDN